ncbi:hypothetical protein C8R48DRAFT_366916 [Suillus tomentosus]|nr:hypothetical protein C8R48DRAFT_366916 [Suillus tomentosus]
MDIVLLIHLQKNSGLVSCVCEFSHDIYFVGSKCPEGCKSLFPVYTRPTPGATRLFRMVVYIWLLGLASLTVTQTPATSVVPWFSRHTIAGQAVFFYIVFLQSHRQGRIYRLDSGFHADRKIMIIAEAQSSIILSHSRVYLILALTITLPNAN